MENKDREINCEDQPIMEEYEAAGSAAPSDVASNRKLLVKLKVKMPEEAVEEEEEEVAAAAMEISSATDQEIVKSHYCKECNKSFHSGKALGGHMSSAHVQANKDYSYKKLNSKMRRQNKATGSSSAATGDNTCALCGKVFRSKKSLFGHMRCHPERDWRGMEPPREMKIDSAEASSEPEFDDGDGDGDGDGYDQIDSGPVVGCNLKGWAKAAKRGRRPMNAASRSPVSSSEEKETFVAGRQLIRLLEGDSMKQKPGDMSSSSSAYHEFDSVDLFNKRKTEYSGAGKLRIYERDVIDDHFGGRKIKKNGSGNVVDDENRVGTLMRLPDDDDSDYERYLGAIEVLVKGKQDQLHDQNPVVMEEKIEMKGDSEKSSPEKYICSQCNKSFHTHQALGGHRSSHNKVKLSITNTADMDKDKDKRANAVGKKKRKSKEAAANADHIVASNAADDDSTSETADKVILGFDLNMTPEEEDKDVDGDTSNQTSNS